MLDDLIIISGLIILITKLIPATVFDECRKEAENLWKNGSPKKWYYAIPIVMIWLLIIYLIARAFLPE